MKLFKKIRNIWGGLLIKLGKFPRLNTLDRKILEEVILPYFSSNPNINNILFVGCEWYTKGYKNYFHNKKYYTIDNDPKKIKFGNDLHIYDKIQNIKKYVPHNHLDLIICNGVLGWGLNNQKEAEDTFADFYDCLSPGGIVMIGWNNIPELRLFLPEETNLTEKLEPYFFPPLRQWRHKIDSRNKHVYDFYYKKY